jgi:hypothetical protein
MSALAVALNDESLATVSSDGLNLVDVRISGDRIGPELGILRVTGGAHEDGAAKQYLTWEAERELVAGDIVSVAFLEQAPSSRPGKTFEELYPDEPNNPDGPWRPPQDMLRELAQQPKHHEQLLFRLRTPDGKSIDGRTLPEEHGFAFWVGWNWLHPNRARVSVHTYTLASLEKRSGGRDHARIDLSFGQAVSFRVGA